MDTRRHIQVYKHVTVHICNNWTHVDTSNCTSTWQFICQLCNSSYDGFNLSLYASTCLSVALSICLYDSLCLCLCLWLSVCLCLCLSLWLSLSVSLSVYLSLSVTLCVSVSLSVSMTLSVCLSLCLSVSVCVCYQVTYVRHCHQRCLCYHLKKINTPHHRYYTDIP